MVQASDYSAVEFLRDGHSVEIRALRPEDRSAFVSAAERSSPQSLYRRFFGARRFTEQEISYFVNVDFINHVALVAVIEENGRPMIIGVGRYVVLPQSRKAEVAFAVVDQYQGQGVGTALMRHVFAIARDVGLRELVGDVLPDNVAMLRTFKKSGLQLTIRRDFDVDVIHVTVQLS